MEKKKGTVPYYTFPLLSSWPGLVHFVSSGAADIGFSGREDHRTVEAHRRILLEEAGLRAEQLVTAEQVHSARVRVVGAPEKGRGALDRESRLPATDALVTAEEGICLMVLSADCVPVLLYEPACRVVAAVHAGWRGTAARIVERTVGVMQRQFGCRPERIRAGIGPSIGPCCFEVGEEVAQVFRGLYPRLPEIVRPAATTGKYRVNLWETNRQELLGAGLLSAHIEVAGMCSKCHPDHFFSYRRDGEKAGRFGAGIALTC